MNTYLTLKEVVDGFPPLRELSQIELPARAAFQIGRALRELTNEASLFDEKWAALLKKYGEPKPGDPTKYNIKEENRAAFDAESKEFLATTVPINYEPIKLSELGGVPLKASWFAALPWLFTD